MPSIAQTFARTLADGYLTAEEKVDLVGAAKALTGARARTAARLVDLVRYDGELDRGERAEAAGLLRRLGAAPATIAAVHSIPGASLDIDHVDLRLDLRSDPVGGRAVYTLGTPGGARAVLEASNARLQIDAVLVDGAAVPFTHLRNRLSFAGEGARTIEVRYRLTESRRYGDTGLVRRSGEFVSLTWPERISELMPGDNRPGRALRAGIEVHAEPGTTIAASGEPLERRPGYARFTLAHDVPAYAVGLFTLRNGEILRRRRDGETIEYVARKGSARARSRRQHHLSVAHATSDFMRARFGAPGAGPVRAIAEVPLAFGGMEHAGCVHVARGDAGSVGDGGEAVTHEVIHQWFGNGVRVGSVADTWLSEGFTTYLTQRAEGERRGPEHYTDLLTAARRDAMHDLSARRRSDTKYPLRPAFDHVPTEAVFDSVTYEYGAFVLSFLEEKLGRATFDAVLGAWYRHANGRAVSTDQFFRFAERQTGEDLATFQAEWVDRLPDADAFAEASARVLRAHAAP